MRQSFTMAKKVEVVGWHRKAGSNECQGKGKFKRSLNSGRPVFSEDIDDGLSEFLLEERAAGRAVSNRLLQEQARKLASEAKLGNFNASSQYLSRWKKRFNVSLRAATNDSQKLPINHAEAVSAFRRTVGTLRLQHEVTTVTSPLPTWTRRWCEWTNPHREPTTSPGKQASGLRTLDAPVVGLRWRCVRPQQGLSSRHL
ncbi:hypothetical protein HPB48_009095 [Haemaphysalis longicornis]|uniref:HTH CENPB-type domain-containing protein n=1 Tax=Haemaphysalis longicornis TaxID=44386 RepID=A0A9J6FW78_HAELO|nr:hypothetical protein HPB48_009095 [Haemaphysalis longicornis]